jgi:hypothetical protein
VLDSVVAALFSRYPLLIARPMLCPTPISHAAIRTTRAGALRGFGPYTIIMAMLLAALFYLPWLLNAAFALRLPALHGASDGATMFAPGGAGTTPRTVFDNSFVLASSASLIGSELPVQFGSGPSFFAPPR